MKFKKCEINFDTNCVDAILADGREVSIDCFAVENEFTETGHDRLELDFLLFTDTEGYADLVLTGGMDQYIEAMRKE